MSALDASTSLTPPLPRPQVAPARNDDAASYAALAAQLNASSRALVVILPKQLGTVYLTPPGWQPAPPLPQIAEETKAFVLHALVVTKKT
jgi:hypothetical protein